MIKRKVFGLVAVLGLSFSSVAMAATSANYAGSFVAIVTTVNSIDITGGDMTVTHTQDNTQGRTVAIEAHLKKWYGYSLQKTIAKVTSDCSDKEYKPTGLTNGNYKLKFVEKSGINQNNGEIEVSGTFKN